ncbi:lycopene cyclase domain-containing protein [Candidatus Parcubacteria bacterium]|nr:lycopene cyclase domain-containing protein [Candidatus Parcubacteria bacterium]
MFEALPIYTFLTLIILIPFTFFVLWKDKHLNKNKLYLILVLSLIATIVWDTVAIKTGIWGFLDANVSWRIIGIPIEEYIFGIWLTVMVLGIYTSLPRFKKHTISEPHFKEIPLLCIIFFLQFILVISLITNPISYIKWLLFFAIIPSIFYLWRKGERIDEVRLLATCLCMACIVIIIDNIFVPLGAWHYSEVSLLGHIGHIYWDDILFGIFNSVIIIGFYTSIPSRKMLTKKW